MDLYHDGSNSYIASATGSLFIDSAADINLDADSGAVKFRDDGTEIGTLTNANNELPRSRNC